MYRYFKRSIDILVSIALFILFSPVMAIVALLIRIKLGSPVLFRQVRPGLHERPFYIYKFRTMADLYDAEGKLLPDTLRFTVFGGVLRKLSLDELPQLINVIKGDMSLIGPRPLLMRYLPYYTDRERTRFQVRPGITGLAQISGRNFLSWDQRLEKDAYYVEKLSFRQDIEILYKTVYKVLKQADVADNPDRFEPALDICRLGAKEGSL